MCDRWKTETGLTRDEFEKFTRFCAADNHVDNRNRAVALGFNEEGVLVAPGAVIRLGSEGHIGKNSFIGLYSYVNGNVVIGECVLIGPHCSLAAGNHLYDPLTGRFSARSEAANNSIEIGDRSWLASGCTVTAGAKIGKANLICANSVITRSTADHAIMAGTPARQIGEINPETGEYTWYESE